MKRFVLILAGAFWTLGVCVPQNAWAGPNEDLISVAKKGDISGVKAALRAGANVNAKDKFGDTSLIWAALNRHENVVRILLNSGAHVNVHDNNRNTALIEAALESE